MPAPIPQYRRPATSQNSPHAGPTPLYPPARYLQKVTPRRPDTPIPAGPLPSKSHPAPARHPYTAGPGSPHATQATPHGRPAALCRRSSPQTALLYGHVPTTATIALWTVRATQSRRKTETRPPGWLPTHRIPRMPLPRAFSSGRLPRVPDIAGSGRLPRVPDIAGSGRQPGPARNHRSGNCWGLPGSLQLRRLPGAADPAATGPGRPYLEVLGTTPRARPARSGRQSTTTRAHGGASCAPIAAATWVNAHGRPSVSADPRDGEDEITRSATVCACRRKQSRAIKIVESVDSLQMSRRFMCWPRRQCPWPRGPTARTEPRAARMRVHRRPDGAGNRTHAGTPAARPNREPHACGHMGSAMGPGTARMRVHRRRDGAGNRTHAGAPAA
jgi:hypothetical protein